MGGTTHLSTQRASINISLLKSETGFKKSSSVIRVKVLEFHSTGMKVSQREMNSPQCFNLIKRCNFMFNRINLCFIKCFGLSSWWNIETTMWYL